MLDTLYDALVVITESHKTLSPYILFFCTVPSCVQICEFTCGHGSPQLVPYFDRAIQISRKRSVEAAGVLLAHEVLQAKLFKAHYLL
jgi:hypothetical protein